jgi:hypothetical protein
LKTVTPLILLPLAPLAGARVGLAAAQADPWVNATLRLFRDLRALKLRFQLFESILFALSAIFLQADAETDQSMSALNSKGLPA